MPLVTVFFTRDYGTACLAKSLLHGEGIAFRVLNAHAGGDMSLLSPTEFQVAEEDVERATTRLRELASQPFGWMPDRAATE